MNTSLHRAPGLWLALLALAATLACAGLGPPPPLPTRAPSAVPPVLPTSAPAQAVVQALPPTFTPAHATAASAAPPAPTAESVPAATATSGLPAQSSPPPTATPSPPPPTAVPPTSAPITQFPPTVIAPSRTPGVAQPPNGAWPAPTAHPFPLALAPRQGVAAVLNGRQPVDDPTLGAWQYSYSPYFRFTLSQVEHVPMLVSSPNPGLTGVPFIVDMAQRTAHDYWLVFNECEHQAQCNSSPQAVADFYHNTVVEVIYNQGADPNARLIVGGSNAHLCGLQWLRDFVTYYQATYGPLPRAGWHFHLYPDMRPANWPASCGGDWLFDDALLAEPPTAFELWREQARSTLAFVQQYGRPDDEIWFSEIGCLNHGYHQLPRPICQADGFMAAYVPNILEWLNNEGRWVTRYAWYTDFDGNYWDATKLYAAADDINRQLSPAGWFYAQVRPAAAVPLPWPGQAGD